MYKTRVRNGFSPSIGEVYLMKFNGEGSEQSGVRLGVVFQNNVGNTNSPNIIALPLTSSLKKFTYANPRIVKSSRNRAFKRQRGVM